MKNLNSILLRVSIALAISVVLSLLFFTIEQPYIAEITSKRPHSWKRSTTFFDLNGDGKSERLLLSDPTPEQTGLIVYDHNDNILDQYNIRGRHVKRAPVQFGDFDNNGITEIFLFTYVDDSLFLNVLDVYNKSEPLVRRKYIDGCRTIDGEAEYMISGPQFEDVNRDGYLELFFSISAGFTLSPRALFCYDIINDTITRSGEAGVGPRYELFSFDIDRDGYKEFWGQYNAVENYKTEIPYTDSSAWLMIYNTRLEYLFEPFEYKGFTSVVKTAVLENEEENKLVVTRSISTKNDSIDDEVAIFSIDGELLVNRNMREYEIEGYTDAYVEDDKIYITNNLGEVLIFDEYLNLVRRFNKDWISGGIYGPVDLNNNGERLIMFLNPSGKLQISTTDLKLLATLDLDDMAYYEYDPVFVSNYNTLSGFHLRTYDYDYTIEFVKNSGRSYIYLYSLIMFISFYSIIYFIQVAQLRQLRRKTETENRLRTLQLQSAKSQMNPHFIFNALNSISAMYIKGDTERADSFLTSFSKMIREVVDSSERIIVKLSEELNFVRHYLELEQVRHGDRLTFLFAIPEECDSIMVPSMSIHTFVENSIKHGFKGKSDSLNITIKAVSGTELSTIYIIDNGLGYRRGKSGDGRQGKGLKMVEEIFAAYHSITRKKISYTIKEVSKLDDSSKTGTIVEIDIQK